MCFSHCPFIFILGSVTAIGCACNTTGPVIQPSWLICLDVWMALRWCARSIGRWTLEHLWVQRFLWMANLSPSAEWSFVSVKLRRAVGVPHALNQFVYEFESSTLHLSALKISVFFVCWDVLIFCSCLFLCSGMQRLGCFSTFRLWAPKSPKSQDSFSVFVKFLESACSFRSLEIGSWWFLIRVLQIPWVWHELSGATKLVFCRCRTRKTAFVSCSVESVRTGRVVRMLRLTRLLRLMKMHAGCTWKRQKWLFRILSSRCRRRNAVMIWKTWESMKNRHLQVQGSAWLMMWSAERAQSW